MKDSHKITTLKETALIYRCPYSQKMYPTREAVEESINQLYEPIMFPGYTYNDHMYGSLEEIQHHINNYGLADPEEVENSESPHHSGGRFSSFVCPLCIFDRAYNKIETELGNKSVVASENLPSNEDIIFHYENDFFNHLLDFHGGKEDLIKFTKKAAETAGMILPEEFVSKFYARQEQADLLKKEKDRKIRRERMEIERKEKEKLELEKAAKIKKSSEKKIAAEKESIEMDTSESMASTVTVKTNRVLSGAHKQKQSLNSSVSNNGASSHFEENVPMAKPKFKSKSSVLNHDTYPCKNCDDIFLSEERLVQHVKSKHGLKK